MKRILSLVAFLLVGIFYFVLTPKSEAVFYIDEDSGVCRDLPIVGTTTFYSTLGECETAMAELGITPPPTAQPCVTDDAPIDTCPDPTEITGNTKSVKIVFNDLQGDEDWHVCSKTSGCKTAEDKVSPEELRNGITVCAADENKLKIDGCDEENDYFHEGKIYTISLFTDEDQDVKGPVAAFYINHFYPNVNIKNENGFIKVDITGDRHPGPVKKGNRNNYQIVIEGKDVYGNNYKKDKCVGIKTTNGTASATFGHEGPGGKTPMFKGKYLIKINEQINEGTFGKIKTGNDPCNGGFTYWHGTIETSSEKPELNSAACIGTEGTGTSTNCKKDPNASDLEGFNELLEEFNTTGIMNLRCSKPRKTSSGYECLEIDTAIGSIPIDPLAFIKRALEIVLSIAGVAALGIIIYGGYIFMTSQGDPERIKGARETLTSAVIGLLFIVFSLVILQVIGADILRIPGFGTVSNP